MARNGSGVYQLPAGQPIAVGTSPISSTTHNTLMSDIATAITGSIAGDGQTVPSANLPMGGFKHTGVADAALRTQYCSAGQSQDNTFDWLTGVAGADTITASAAIGMIAYAAGQTFRFVTAGSNTGAATLNINSIGAKAIKKDGTTALFAGDLPSGAVIEVVYDGTNFQIIRNGAASRVGQTWQAVTGSRSAGVTYTNSGTHPIAVQIYGSTSLNNQTLQLTIGGINLIGGIPSAGGVSVSLFGIVPPGATYSCTATSGTPTIAAWNELS